LEYEVKWEDDEELSWEPEESFGKGGKGIWRSSRSGMRSYRRS
jgi:hypothetical protein